MLQPPGRRRLPHVEEPGQSYFVTIVLRDRQLTDLTQPRVATELVQALRHFDSQRYLLFDYTIMPDHVHFIAKPLDGFTLSGVYHSFKSFTAHRIKRLLGRSGSVWEDDSYDRVIRSRTDFEEKAKYILMNPVNRGLVRDPAESPGGDEEAGSCRRPWRARRPHYPGNVTLTDANQYNNILTAPISSPKLVCHDPLGLLKLAPPLA